MPDLLLHVGHVKTGSSWLQEAFRQNAGRLAAHGIRYPLPRAGGPNYDRATPAGNATTLLDDPRRLGRRLRRAAPDAARATLLSSEILFNRLAGQRSLGAVVAAARGLGFARVRLLLFTRAPLPLAASIWQQRVKGWEGETRDLDAFAAAFDLPRRLHDFVAAARATEGAELTFLNYDAHRGALLDPVEAWLGLPAGTLERPAAERLNRSLTRAEAALQLALNRAMGPSQEVFAHRLAHRLPDLPPDPPRIAPAAAREMLARHAAALDGLDALLPPGEALDRRIPEAPAAAPLALDAAQMAVIAEGIAAYLRPSLETRLWRTNRALRFRLLQHRRARRGRT